jgi:hypothetical protein
MSLVKEYNGVKIFVSQNGEFYCDVIANTNDYKNKTFGSFKLQSVESAIDNYDGRVVDGNEYYDIQESILLPLKVTSRVGNRLFFNDNTDTSHYNRKKLYPKSIETTPEFKELEIIFKKINDTNIQIKKLYDQKYKLYADAGLKINTFSKVIVS